MITEVFVAAVAAFVWVRTGPGTLHSLAYNMMFIASVSTIVFNANPLLRFDGYYILSDLLDIPNLHTRATRHLRHLVERYLFGYKDSHSPAGGLKEGFWLSAFGVASGLYRVLVFTGIILFVADKFLLAGLLMALICLISWGLVPLFRFVSYLGSSPRLAKTRVRAMAFSLSLLILVVSFLAICPFPNRFRAPGVTEATQYARVVNDAPGYIEAVITPSGAHVSEGTPLIKLKNRELHLQIKAAEAQRQEVLAMQRLALHKKTAELDPIQKRLETIEVTLRDFREEEAALLVRARESGIWVAPNIQETIGTWLHRGSVVGEIVNQDAFRFSAVVSQDQAADLFARDIRKAEVRLYGQGGRNLSVRDFQIIPFQQERLPSVALGWRGGGEIPVSISDETGLQAAEPFFQIKAEIQSSTDVVLLHGRSGKLRLTLAPKPLLVQWATQFRQLLQKRYQI
jgi:putative peptide zinc metalloprotease protein